MEGGVGAFTQELAKALADLGHEPHILTNRAARPPTKERKVSDLFQPVDLGYAQLHPKIRQWRWSSLRTAVDWAIRHNLDVVNIQYQAAAFHMNSPVANFLPWRLRGVVKTAVTFHDLRTPFLFPKAGSLRQRAIYFMAKKAHGAIVTNGADFEELNTESGKWRMEAGDWRLSQIPIGSNITPYEPEKAEIKAVRAELGLDDNGKLLGYFGFLNENKGADRLLQALAQLDQNTHLVFIGGQTGASDSSNQSFLDGIKQLVTDLGLNDRVHWTGFVPDQGVSTYLHAADMMVMPYKDGVSLRRGTLMAILAHGRSLITTKPTMPTPEMMHGENCWLVPPDEADSLAQAIQELLADEPKRRKLGAGAEKVAGLFSWERIAQETAVFYQQLLKNKA